jgi:hypothetical protein
VPQEEPQVWAPLVSPLFTGSKTDVFYTHVHTFPSDKPPDTHRTFGGGAGVKKERHCMWVSFPLQNLARSTSVASSDFLN